MTSVSAPFADTGSIQQTRAGMLALVEQRLRHLLAPQQAHRSGTGPRPAFTADGGERLRPVFCVSGFLAAGGNPGDPVAVDTCAALELLHLSARFPDDPASAHADRLATRLPAAARTVWNELRTEPVTGRHPDNPAAAESAPAPAPATAPAPAPALSRQPAVHEPGPRTIHRPLVLGALLAGRPEVAPAFESYGLALDEAFQLRDDLIDVFGPTPEDTGRPPGLRRGPALLLALAAEHFPRTGALLARNGHSDAALLRRLLDESNTKATAERRIAGLVDRACAALATPALDQPWRQEFSRLATRLAYRSR
ncbi:polyprenyl synthetase family protein [Streptomyces cacaoi]